MLFAEWSKCEAFSKDDVKDFKYDKIIVSTKLHRLVKPDSLVKG